jgi:hypothetical protein
MFDFFMKKLVVDTSAEEIARATSILDRNNIKYELRTTRTRGSIGSALDARSYAQGNIALYKGASGPTFIYTVCVTRKEYDLAWKLLYGA